MAAAEASKRSPDSADRGVICTLKGVGLGDARLGSFGRALCASRLGFARGGVARGGVARGAPARAGAAC